ncbi:MAG: hypothetical protein LAP39_05775 [Acidobacteriia bacterium]|nr:hypothetical protein [Terriglobia bacterium]
MNINKTIRELIEEKKRLDRVIGTLEEMQRNGRVEVVLPPVKKRGRKSMDEQARQQVSERMKRYWETRRRRTNVLEPNLGQGEA